MSAALLTPSRRGRGWGPILQPSPSLEIKMPSYKYPGLSKDQRKSMLDGMLSQLDYPETRASEMYYHDLKKDEASLLAEKEKRRAKYRKEREDEFSKKLEKADLEFYMADLKLPKGHFVEVDERSPYIKKLDALVKSGKLAKDEKAKTEKAAQK
jgi:hypothetical protein